MFYNDKLYNHYYTQIENKNFKNNELVYFRKIDKLPYYIEIHYYNNFFEVSFRIKSKSNGYIMRRYNQLEKAINLANLLNEKDVKKYLETITNINL